MKTRLALFVFLAVLSGAAAADEAGWAALRQPGTVAVMRHATAPGTGDPPDMRLDDCATQRNLSEAGRAEARAVGAAMRAQGIAVDQVLTSQWCRCRETAQLLAVAPVEDFPALNSFFGERSRSEAQTAALRRFITGLAPGRKVVLVTHQVNVTALTGVYPRSGEIVVVRPAGDGVEVVGRIAP